MTIKDFNLLEIDVFQGDKLIYNGMCEDAPQEIKDAQIKIRTIDGKKVLVEIV